MRSIATSLLVLAACAGVAYGDVLFPAALTLDTGYHLGPTPPYPFMMAQTVGDPLYWFGRVSDVGSPFDDLLPPAGYELTYAFESTCVGADNFDGPCSGGEHAVFQGGTLTVYLDATPDADYANLSTFRDGDVVLVATLSLMYVGIDDPFEICPMVPDQPDAKAFLSIVGGVWFDRVSNHGQGMEATCSGEIYPDVPADLMARGYVCGADGILDVYAPLTVTTTTWGHIKSLYR